MTSDLDIFRTANVLVKRYGEGAALETVQRADAILEKGSVAGQMIWKRVLSAVKETQREEPEEGEAVSYDCLGSGLEGMSAFFVMSRLWTGRPT